MNPVAKRVRKYQTLKNEYYNLRPMLGYANWAIFYILLGGREAGKSYSVTDFFVSQFVKNGRPFVWMRLTEKQARKLLNNNANGLPFPFGSKREFISDWNALSQEMSDGKGEVMKEMKYGLQFATKYKVALAEINAIREINKGLMDEIRSDYKSNAIDKEEMAKRMKELRSNTPSFLELKTMSPRDFADLYKDQIMEKYRTLKQQGKTGEEAGDVISSEWFGSE